jgi:ribonuclease HII
MEVRKRHCEAPLRRRGNPGIKYSFLNPEITTLAKWRARDDDKALLIAGVDEAGRGPLAGPVVAAAVIANPDNLVEGVRDSKKLSKKSREDLFGKITSNYIWSVGIISPEIIDEINILEATKKACINAVSGLSVVPLIVLVDGNMKFDDTRFQSIVKGDDKSHSIAAASIIAKVTRDRIMTELEQEFPDYQWSRNSGYGTEYHLKAIRDFGLTKHHRKTFRVKSL